MRSMSQRLTDTIRAEWKRLDGVLAVGQYSGAPRQYLSHQHWQSYRRLIALVAFGFWRVEKDGDYYYNGHWSWCPRFRQWDLDRLQDIR